MEQDTDNAPEPSAVEIKKYADAVNLPKSSIIQVSNYFTKGMTNIVQDMKKANLLVFVHLLKNEFVSLAFDYLADPYLEIATYVQHIGVDGIVTAFPATVNRYLSKHFLISLGFPHCSEQINRVHDITLLIPIVSFNFSLIPYILKVYN